MNNIQSIINRSRRHHEIETRRQTIHRPGQTLGHFTGGSGGTLKAYCKEDAPEGHFITCWLSYNELNVQVYASTATYADGNIVTDGDNYWLSLQDDNTGNTLTEGAYWSQIHDYDEAEEYTAGDYVRYDNRLWRCKATTTGDIPQEGTYWTTKAAAYSAGTAYIVGNRVTYDSKLWRCILAGTGQTPAAGSSYWTEIAEIEVYCDIACGDDLNLAFPRLLEQQAIEVVYSTANARYEAAALFQATEETCAEGGMMEFASTLLTTDVSSSTLNDYVDVMTDGRGLGFSAYANSTYDVEIGILFSTDSAAVGIKLQLTGPGDAVSVDGSVFGNFSGSFSGAVFTAFSSAVAVTKNSTGIKMITLKALIATGDTAGDVRLQFCTAQTGVEAKILIGSIIEYRRVYYDQSPAV